MHIENGVEVWYKTFAWVEESRRIDERMRAKRDKTFFGRIRKKAVELFHTIG